MVGSLKNKVAKGSMWVMLEQFAVQGLNFGMGIVLARLLTPTDYGTVSLVTIFITIATVLVNSGLGQALVQKPETDELDFNSVFYVSFGLSCVLYLALFFAAPAVAAYYGVAELKTILRVLALNLPMYAVNSIQSAELFKKMRFDVLFRISLVTAVASAAVGIGLALCGYGVWALVLSSVLSNFAGVLARWFFIVWHPKWMFSIRRVTPLFRFGWKMMVSSLFSALVSNFYGMLIGKYHTSADLAFVNKGKNIPDLLKGNIQTSVVEAAFPAVVRLQDDRDRFVEALRRLLVVSTFIVFPLMTLVAVTSRRTILFLYGEKWLPCVPFAQLTCLSAIFMSIAMVNELGITARGRSDVFLKLNLVKHGVSLSLMFALLPKSLMWWMMATTFFYVPLSVCIDMVANRRLLHLSITRQLRDVLPMALLSGVVAGFLALSNCLYSGTSPWVLFAMLACQAAASALIYVTLAVAFRLRAAREILQFVPPQMVSRFPLLDRIVVYACGQPNAGSAAPGK